MSDIVNSAVDSVKNFGQNVSETVKGNTREASKESEKKVAKDNDAPLDTRAHAAFDAAGDKAKQHEHEAKANVHEKAQ
jgi:hypothetical protein